MPQEKVNYFLNEYNSLWAVLLLTALTWKDDDYSRSYITVLTVPFYLSNGDIARAIYHYPTRRFEFLEVKYNNIIYEINL